MKGLQQSLFVSVACDSSSVALWLPWKQERDGTAPVGPEWDLWVGSVAAAHLHKGDKRGLAFLWFGAFAPLSLSGLWNLIVTHVMVPDAGVKRLLRVFLLVILVNMCSVRK